MEFSLSPIEINFPWNHFYIKIIKNNKKETNKYFLVNIIPCRRNFLPKSMQKVGNYAARDEVAIFNSLSHNILIGGILRNNMDYLEKRLKFSNI